MIPNPLILIPICSYLLIMLWLSVFSRKNSAYYTVTIAFYWLCVCCFSIRVFFKDTDDSQDSKGREGSMFYSTLPLPPAHEHWEIYLQLCTWDDYHVFLIATLVFTRLLLDEIYHLIELPFEWLIDDATFVCLPDELALGFCYSDLTLETGWFDLASTITLILQANRLTKRASHPKVTLVVCQIFHYIQFLS